MSELVVTRNQMGSVMEANRDDVIVIRLDENMTTGYSWETEIIDQAIIELVDSFYNEAPGKALGRGGTRFIRFVAKSAGSGEIHLRLRRPWESPDKAIDHLQVTIRVR